MPGMMVAACSSARAISAAIRSTTWASSPSDAVAHPQAEIGRHLVVARARGVQAAGGFADDFLEAGLDVHVDVFERGLELEPAGLDLSAHAVQPGLDGGAVLPRG